MLFILLLLEDLHSGNTAPTFKFSDEDPIAQSLRYEFRRIRSKKKKKRSTESSGVILIFFSFYLFIFSKRREQKKKMQESRSEEDCLWEENSWG